MQEALKYAEDHAKSFEEALFEFLRIPSISAQPDHADDDKGPTLGMVCAAEAWTLGAGGLPLNLKFVVEGEEESGGDHLAHFIRENPEKLKADALAILDVPAFQAGGPALAYGLRGILTLEIRIAGPNRDLHSGGYGGTVENPAEVVARLVASCRAPDGSIAIDGLYDDVA